MAMSYGEPLCPSCVGFGFRRCVSPYSCLHPYRAGWLKRDMERATKQVDQWRIRDLKNSVPNRLAGVRVTDEGEAV